MISGEYRCPFLNKHRRLEKEQGLGKYGDLSIGCIALEMPLRHSSGDVQWAVSPVGLEFLGLRSVLEGRMWKSSTHTPGT